MPSERHRRGLEKLFDRKPVAQITELRRALGVRSRTTVFFVLKATGYLTSYSHAGRYYTLGRIPKFDAHGLWAVGGIRFSRHGTLRATIVVLVCAASAGCTHEELTKLLGLRVHDTLRSRVETHSLGREQVQAGYVSLDPGRDHPTAQARGRARTCGLEGPRLLPTVRRAHARQKDPAAQRPDPRAWGLPSLRNRIRVQQRVQPPPPLGRRRARHQGCCDDPTLREPRPTPASPPCGRLRRDDLRRPAALRSSPPARRHPKRPGESP